MKKTHLTNDIKISIRHSNLIVTSIILLFCVLLAVNTIRMYSYTQQSIKLSKAHARYANIASQLTSGADILTEQARLFAETGQTKYMVGYFKEANVSKHRDNALAALDTLPWVHMDDRAKKAMQKSVNLMEIECYSMRLAALGYGLSEDELPDELKNVTLTPQDALLSPEEAKLKARSMLFDDAYYSAKNGMKAHLNTYLNDIIGMSQLQYDEITQKLNKSSIRQTILIALLILSVLSIMTCMHSLIIKPIITASKNIKKALPIKMPSFLDELNALDISYNNLHKRNAALLEELNAMAREDTLTGLGNRLAYKDYIDRIQNKNESVLLFLFDVNNLRDKNNSEGHAEGDKLLIDTANCIRRVFGIDQEENCFRIGGDEFIAFIEREPLSCADTYVEKFMAESEQHNISVSVGYAYASDMSHSSICKMFRDADEAMYCQKHGKKL